MKAGLKVFYGIAVTSAIIVATYIIVKVNDLMGICYELSGYKLKSIDEKHIYIDIDLRIKNPATLNIILNGYTVDVFINNTWVANTQSNQKKVIRGKEISTIPLLLKINHSKVWDVYNSRSIIELLMKADMEKIFIEMKGKLNGSVFNFPVTVPINTKMSLRQIDEAVRNPSPPC